MVGVLDRKLVRELWGMKGQALAIAMVIGSGVATLVMSLATLHSLRLTQADYYRQHRMPELFASLKRAPLSLLERVREVPGIQRVEARVVAYANLELSGFDQPVSAQLVSIPAGAQPAFNRIHLKQGRLPAPGRDEEIVISEAFAEAHGMLPDDTLDATIHGRRRRLRVVGLGMTPEYIYQIGPGAMIPDFETFAVIWIARQPLEAAVDMDGAFNDLAASLSADARLEQVIERLDLLLQRYGGLGAYGRKDQLSHRFLSEEFKQLATMATLFPTIFLGVAAFLLNVVIGRLVHAQREQIAILKAFGYSNLEVGLHYLKQVLAIVAVGVVIGGIEGAWLGRGLSRMYTEYYRFPWLSFELQPRLLAWSALVSAAAAVAGCLWSLRRAVSLPPAEAMRPEAPHRFREALIERLGLKQALSQPTRMIARHLERRPLKSLLSVLGIASACGILMVSSFFQDSVEFMIHTQFSLTQLEDLTVSFVEPTSRRALHELRSLPGVHQVEPMRSVPVRLRHARASYRTSLDGLPARPLLYRPLDNQLQPIQPPPTGLLLTAHLAQILGLQAGDLVEVEVLDGARPRLQIPVMGLVKQYIGVSALMQLDELNRLLDQGDAVNGARLKLDSAHRGELYRELNRLPVVAGSVVREKARRQAQQTIGEQMLTFALFATLLAATIAFGVVYNSARIALSERGWELASLRVLGYTRGEISYILLGELVVLTLCAIPLGFAIGYGLCVYFVHGLTTDLFRVPLVVEPSTYAFAASVVIVSAAISALVVRRRLDHLDLVAVLKTRE